MRKLGFGKRLLTILLVMALCFSMVSGVRPRVTNAATGDLVTGDNAGQTGLKDGVDDQTTISWPIKIYDYLQDGMLFDYSSASDFNSLAEYDGGAYGGGANVPMIRSDLIIGVDYTISTTYDSSKYGYAFNTWGNKSCFGYNVDGDGCREVTRSVVEAQDNVSPMYLHVDYTMADVNTRSYGWVANFARDDKTYYTGDDVRYMVIVYRTNEAYSTNTSGKGRTFYTYWAVSDGAYSSDYNYHTNTLQKDGIDISDLTDEFGWNKTGTLFSELATLEPSTDTWAYQVVDMKTDRTNGSGTYPGIAANWNATWTNSDGTTGSIDLSEDERVAGVGISYPVATKGEAMDISHIAFFSNLEEAARFGENALEFDNDPGEYIGRPVTMSQTVSSGSTTTTTTYPNPGITSNGWDFTASGNAAWTDTPYSDWTNSTYDMKTSKQTDPKGYTYTRLGSNDGYYPDSLLLYSSSGMTKTSNDYIVIVYKTYNMNTTRTTGFGVYGDGGYNGWGSSGAYATQKTFPLSSSWAYFYYPLTDDGDGNLTNSTKIYQIQWYLPGLTTTEYIDIAFVDYRADETAAKNFGQAAVNYLTHYGETTTTTTSGGNVTTTTSFGDKEAVWTMGSNQAFTMLYASTGGGWFDLDNNDSQDSSSAGGNNPWTNGYFSYAIGNKYTYPTDTMNSYRSLASSHNYTVSNSIYLLDLYPTCSTSYGTFTNTDGTTYTVTSADAKASTVSKAATMLQGVDYTLVDTGYSWYAGVKSLDMSKLDLGYTLYNSLTEGVMTAGLLQSSQATVTGIDGNRYTIIQYKTDTVSYIARLLQQTLVIPERDGWGYNYTFVKGTPNGAQYGYADEEETQPYDLASALRARLGITFTAANYAATTKGAAQATATAALGSATDTAGRLYDENGRNKLIGPFLSCKDSITTFYDAAYYLLHNLFVDNSYNQVQNDYNYLVLSKGTLSANDKEAYVFDAGFTTSAGGESGVTYDPLVTTDGVTTGTGTITMTSGNAKDKIYYGAGSYTTTRFPFLPVTDAEGLYGEDMDRYHQEDGATNVTDYADTYSTRNYNYVMQANGEFVYHSEDGLFFQFEGDDDVYLFINGELVLDIGAAHAITAVSMEMNDYVTSAQEILKPLKDYGYYDGMPEADFTTVLATAKAANATASDITDAQYLRWHRLNLVEGESYSIDFYYMERHGWGANMRVGTNIVMTDPALVTEKKAYQGGDEISYGGIVDNTKPIEYSFSITNNGNSKLYNLTFQDNDIGVTLDPVTGLTVGNAADGTIRVSDASGTFNTLDATDLVAYVDGFYDDGTAYETIKVTFADNAALIEFLQTLKGEGLQSGEGTSDQSGGGLWRNSTVTIRGVYYTMTATQKSANQFKNTVHTSATPSATSSELIKSEASFLVRSVGQAIHIYQWAGHPVTLNRETIKEAVKVAGMTLDEAADQFLMVLSNSDQSDSNYYGNVSYLSGEDPYKYLVVNYASWGSYTNYIKIMADTGKDGTPDVRQNDSTGDDNDRIQFVPMIVHVTEVADSNIVLDYGLAAKLTDEGGILSNDRTAVSGVDSSVTVMGISGAEPSYLGTYTDANYTDGKVNRIAMTPDADNTIACNDGKYTVENGTLKFTPTDFMDETYDVWTAITVHETSKTPSTVGPADGNHPIDVTKEVQMYQKVTVLPANVVYYEDDFTGTSETTGITYTGDFETTGTGSGSLIQSVDQTIPYGQDPEYQKNHNTTMSGNSLHTYQIQETGDNVFASFTFTGTGFEIIGQTNAADSGTMVVKVTDVAKLKANPDKPDDAVVYLAPVITEFDNTADSEGDSNNEVIHQVPVVRVDGLVYGSYTVSLSGTPEYDSENPLYWESSRSHYDLEGYSPITQEALNELLDHDASACPGGTDHHTACEKYGGVTHKCLKTWVGKYITEEEFNKLSPTSDNPSETCPKRAQDLVKWLGVFRYSKNPPLCQTQPKLYIDGVRIFQPYGETGADGKVIPGSSVYYNASENTASFEELRELLQDGKAAVINKDDAKDSLWVCTSNMIWTENRNGDYSLNRVSSIDDYVVAGPNNELYYRRSYAKDEVCEDTDTYQMLLLYVTEDADASTTGSLQVALRVIDEKGFKGNGSGTPSMVVKYIEGNYVERPLPTVVSSTEQYYNINYSACPSTTVDGKTVYTVIIRAGTTNQSGMLSFTSVKHNGLEILKVVDVSSSEEGYADKYLSGSTWEYNANGLLTEKTTGGTNPCVHFDMRALSYIIEEADKVPEEIPEVVPAPSVTPMTNIVVDDGNKGGFSIGIMVLFGLCSIAALVGTYLLTKKYLHYL